MMATAHRSMRKRANAMPLADFPIEHQERIRKQVEAPKPPPRWTPLGDDGHIVLAAIENRAWYEWHWQRGIEPGRTRDKLPENLRTAVIQRDGYICQICRGDIEPEDLHIDHIKPWSKGGRHTLDNLQATHSECNLRKGIAFDGPD